MTLLDIEAFLAVAKYRTVSKASEELYISHSTLSWRISNLEKEVGNELFVRRKGIKRVELTHAGATFLPYAEKIKHLWEQALAAVQKTTAPQLSIAMGHGHKLLFEDIYKLFYEQYPDATLTYVLRHADEAYSLVSAGKLDAAIVARVYPNKKVNTLPLCDENEVLLCGSHCAFANKPVVSKDDLDIDQCIRWWLNASSAEEWFQQFFPDHRFTRIVNEDLNLLESILNESEHWTVLPESTAKVFLQRRGNGLCIKDTDFAGPIRHMFLLTRKD